MDGFFRKKKTHKNFDFSILCMRVLWMVFWVGSYGRDIPVAQKKKKKVVINL